MPNSHTGGPYRSLEPISCPGSKIIYKGARHWTQISDPQRAMHSLLVASSSALALRACPPQLVASSSAARAARSPTTARRCAFGSSARAARSLALRARPPQLVARSSALALRARLLGGSRCALARHGSSQAPPLEFAFSSARLAPRSIFLYRCVSPKFRASAELDRSSPWSLKQALMFGTSRRSSQLPWPPKPPPRTESQAV